MSKTSIIVADDQPLIRDGLAAILNMEEQCSVVARTGDGLETVHQVEVHRPQLVLMDIHMPKLDGLQATQRIKLNFPDTQIIILTTFQDEEYIYNALRYGANGYLVKGAETKQILATIRDCLDGRINYPASVQSRLIQSMGTSIQEDPQLSNETSESSASNLNHNGKLADLSIQEQNILWHLMQGKSNQAIAADLYITTGSVKNYLTKIYKKLHVTNRSEAFAYLHKIDK